MKFKKFLSAILSLILLLNPVLPKRTYAVDPNFNAEDYLSNHCSKKNFKGNYESSSCAAIAAENILRKGEKDYVLMENVGDLADEKIYYFTFRALDKILDEIGLDLSEDKLREEWQSLKKERISYFSPLKNILRVGIGSLIGALGGNELYSLAQSNYEGHHKSSHHKSSHKNHHNHKSPHGLEISEQKRQGNGNFLRDTTRVISKLGANAMMLIGATCVGLITSILLKIKNDIAEKSESEIFDKVYRIKKLNGKKAFALNMMLDDIKKSNYSNKDFFAVDGYKKDSWMFYSGKLGLNYTEEEKASFPEKFKKLAQDIEKNLGRRLEKKDEQ